MRISPYLLAVLAAGLVACGTVTEQPSAPASDAQAEAPVPEAVSEPVPAPGSATEAAPAPVPASSAQETVPQRPAVKQVRVVKRSPAPVAVPVPAKTTAPTEQEMAAARAAVDEALGRYVLEQARFSAPATLKRDGSGTATLEFTSGAAFDKAREAIAANELVRKAGIQVSNRVQGQLTGENIGVKAGSTEIQELSGAAAGKWQWQLVPSAEGKAKLHLVVSVDTVVAGSATPRSIHTIDKEITVEAAPAPAAEGSFFSANWWWLLILLVLAVAGAWFAKRKA